MVIAEGVAGVQDVSVTSRGGVERAAVLAWEQRHNVVMPQALRSLYMATDGFKLTWNYSTAGTNTPFSLPPTPSFHPLLFAFFFPSSCRPSLYDILNFFIPAEQSWYSVYTMFVNF